MEDLLAGLKAAGESTRLRLLSLCAHCELSVTELTQILSQSQPRVSRHLKLMVDAGLLKRTREGAQVFYRIAVDGPSGALAQTLVDLIPDGDETLALDLARLEQTQIKRAEIAAKYFSENAGEWDKVRALHVPESDVESALLKMAEASKIGTLLDIGTGTGRVLELLAPHVDQGTGIDISPEMLAIARSQLDKDEYRHLQVRKADMYAMPVENESVDLAILHLVLHFSHEPKRAIAEAVRTLAPKGRLLVIDFETHNQEQLREEHQHVRLGFSSTEMHEMFIEAGLNAGESISLVGDPLTVNIWQGIKA